MQLSATGRGLHTKILSELENKFDAIYDQGTGKYSLCVSRGGGKQTVRDTYAADQTGVVLLACPAGKKIQVVGAYISTSSSAGKVSIHFAALADIIFPLYATKYQAASNEDMALIGAVDADVKVTSTTGAAEEVFVLVNYRILQGV